MPNRSDSSNSLRRYRVAIMVDPGDSWGRRVILGISGAVRHLLPWDLVIAPQDDQWRLRVPPGWHGDGIIAAIRDDKTADHVRALQLPTVHVSLCEKSADSQFRVITDDRKRAELAFRHFQERGFTGYAYYGPQSQRYPVRRGEIFRDVVREAGHSCEIFEMSPVVGRNSDLVQKQTREWLKGAPKPLAILAADPHPALQLMEICQSLGIHVPEEVAILAGDSDDVLCEISDPPMSSILLASEQIGAESVQMLRSLIEGNLPPEPTRLIPPIGVIGRRSTDILAVSDPMFVKAVRYIRETAHTGIQVSDVLRVVPISRRSLEQRFQQLLHCSPADEIRNVRLSRVKQLLISTEQTIEQIADCSGFSSASQLSFAFRRATNQTPAEFRRQNSRRREI
ncbi:MAG: AraC family transcriptional regulator [Planctomyces sp.]|nr:AraC family transcriptional regulator [Planctomyces sp.]